MLGCIDLDKGDDGHSSEQAQSTSDGGYLVKNVCPVMEGNFYHLALAL